MNNNSVILKNLVSYGDRSVEEDVTISTKNVPDIANDTAHHFSNSNASGTFRQFKDLESLQNIAKESMKGYSAIFKK